MTATSPTPAPTPTSSTPLLEVDELNVRFRSGGRDVHAVNGLSYSLAAGRTLAIVGESGSGKTASSRAIMGLLPASASVSGSVKIGGTELIGLSEKELRRHRGVDVAMIFQDPARSLNPTMRIGAQITEAIRSHRDVSRADARERAVELLSLVRLAAPHQRFDEYAHQLSGGMRQRVMIAMALACEPRVLIADEATTALDVTTQAQIMRLIGELQERFDMGVVMISHDLGLAATYADEVIVMYAGRAVEHASTAELFAHVRMPYTRALLEAVPRLNPEGGVNRRGGGARVPGRPPDLSQPITGCAFAPRCPRKLDRCETERPPFEEHRPGHRAACWNPEKPEEKR